MSDTSLPCDIIKGQHSRVAPSNLECVLAVIHIADPHDLERATTTSRYMMRLEPRFNCVTMQTFAVTTQDKLILQCTAMYMPRS